MANADQPTLQNIAAIPEPIARIGALAKWITVRMDDLTQFEARLEKRFEHLSKTEENLRKLFDALRSEVSAAHPLISQIGAARQELKTQWEKAPAPQPVAPAPSADEPMLSAKAVEIEARLNDLVRQADESITRRVRGFDEDLSATIDTAKAYLQSAADSTRMDAEAITDSLSHKLELAEKVAADISQRIDNRMQEGVDRAYNAIDMLAEPLKRKIMEQFGEFENHVQTAIQDVQQEAVNRIGAVHHRIDELAVRMDHQMDSVADDFKRRADMTLQSSKLQVRQQLDVLGDEIKMMAQPVLQLIDQRRASVEMTANAMLNNIEESMKVRMDDLRKSGESTVEMAEAQLIEKLKAIRPQASATIGTIEKQFAQRLDLAIETARQAIELCEQQMMDRIAELRPRATAAAMAAHKELTEQLSAIESEAATTTHGIAERLSHRIDELTYHARKNISEEIRALDAATEKLRKSEKMVKSSSPDAGSVEVDILVEQTQRLDQLANKSAA